VIDVPVPTAVPPQLELYQFHDVASFKVPVDVKVTVVPAQTKELLVTAAATIGFTHTSSAPISGAVKLLILQSISDVTNDNGVPAFSIPTLLFATKCKSVADTNVGLIETEFKSLPVSVCQSNNVIFEFQQLMNLHAPQTNLFQKQKYHY